MGFDPQTEAQLQLLADSDNRAIVTVLDEVDRPLHVKELAERLVDRETAVLWTTEYEHRVEETILSLHHDHLPRLAAANLVEYDSATNTATRRNSTAPTGEWHDATAVDELVAHLSTNLGTDNEDGIRVITGRHSVIEYGRQLADEADEELFCMYASTDLLGDECVRRAEQALDRGVTMYMGSQNPEVRDLTRNRLSEATIWEPQFDWLNTPTYPRVGRLVLVDRRKVMLAILEEPTSEETSPDETAIIADGKDHPIVVLVRELLGPRLDHLDYQSEDFRTELSLDQ